MVGISGSSPQQNSTTKNAASDLKDSLGTTPVEFVDLARRLLDARSRSHFPAMRELHTKILQASGIAREELDSLSPQEVLTRSKNLRSSGKEVLAYALWSIALARLEADDPRDIVGAFATAEKALILNKFNPDIVRLMWQTSRKSFEFRRDGKVVAAPDEVDREMIVTLDALGAYVEEGLKLKPIELGLPPNWKEKAAEWRAHAGWALENWSSMLEARATEILKRVDYDQTFGQRRASRSEKVELVPPGCTRRIETVKRIQSLSESAAFRALEVSGIPHKRVDLAAMASSGSDPRWGDLDREQQKRLARVAKVLGKLVIKRGHTGGTSVDYAGLEQIANWGARSASEKNAPAAQPWSAMRVEQVLSRDALLKPAVLPQAEAGLVSSSLPQQQIPSRVEGAAGPRAGQAAGAAVIDSSNRAATAPPPSSSRSASFGPSTDADVPTNVGWEHYFQTHRLAAERRLSLDDLQRFKARAEKLSLPPALTEAAVIRALARSVTFAAVVTLAEPSRSREVLGSLVNYASITIKQADQALDVASIMEVLSVYGALRALRESRAGLLQTHQGRALKVEVDRAVPALISKSREIAELLEGENACKGLTSLMGSLEQAFQLVRAR